MKRKRRRARSRCCSWHVGWSLADERWHGNWRRRASVRSYARRHLAGDKIPPRSTPENRRSQEFFGPASL